MANKWRLLWLFERIEEQDEFVQAALYEAILLVTGTEVRFTRQGIQLPDDPLVSVEAEGDLAG